MCALGGLISLLLREGPAGSVSAMGRVRVARVSSVGVVGSMYVDEASLKALGVFKGERRESRAKREMLCCAVLCCTVTVQYCK